MDYNQELIPLPRRTSGTFRQIEPFSIVPLSTRLLHLAGEVKRWQPTVLRICDVVSSSECERNGDHRGSEHDHDDADSQGTLAGDPP